MRDTPPAANGFKWLLRIVALVVLVVILSYGAIIVALFIRFPLPDELTDRIPAATETGKLAAAGYPHPVTRIVDIDTTGGMTGDGETLKILCFPSDQIEKMKSVIASSQSAAGEWRAGLPAERWWISYMGRKIPHELALQEHAPAEDYIHLKVSPHACLIIDKKRGISYEYRLFW
ncbi:MAG: hypothetical protein KF712_15075 [Akkermansiaceae bacterium]|nr:hypothetical protein [Akkermansiaceae bacterium]